MHCPVCGAAPKVARLSYKTNCQVTDCPNKHRVIRFWNGPESRAYDRGLPYGWTAWKAVYE
jgi:hypothetical protein